MVLKNEDEFFYLFGTLHQKLSNNTIVAIIHVFNQVGIILRYHGDLRHTQAWNLYEFLKVHFWWSTMRAGLEKVLQQCENCEMFSLALEPPKSVIFITVE